MNEPKRFKIEWVGYDNDESIPITEKEFSLYPPEFAEQLRKAEIENAKKNELRKRNAE